MDLTRDLSWSAIASFEYDPEQWYRSYVLGIKQTSKEMDFGNWVDKRLQNFKHWLPEVERFPFQQYKFNPKFNGIKLVGFADGLDLNPKAMRLKDDKTGKKEWTQQRADETGQLTMYLFMLWLEKEIPPEKVRCFISWLPTKDVKGKGMLQNKDSFAIDFRDDPVVPIIFETRRSMRQLLEFGGRIKRVWLEMQQYAEAHP